MKFFVALLLIFGFLATFASADTISSVAPLPTVTSSPTEPTAKPPCISVSKIESTVLGTLVGDFVVEFASSFIEAFDTAIVVTNLGSVSCFEEPATKFLFLQILEFVNTSVPGYSNISDDLDMIVEKLYH